MENLKDIEKRLCSIEKILQNRQHHNLYQSLFGFGALGLGLGIGVLISEITTNNIPMTIICSVLAIIGLVLVIFSLLKLVER